MDYHAVCSIDCRISETVVSRAAADTIGTTTSISMTSTASACNSRSAGEDRDTKCKPPSTHYHLLASPRANKGQRSKSEEN
jgi:hypothetical protein